MNIFKKALPRRTFLRGAGASIALPMLDAMLPALASPSHPAGKIPLRVGYVYIPNGIRREVWRPARAGADFEMTPLMKKWEAVRDQLLILSNMDNGYPTSVTGHVASCAMYLTSSVPNRSFSEIYCGVSADQLMAKELGKETPLPSLEVCIENAAELAGQSAGGYSSAYTNTISWGGPATPLPMEHRPREIFERLFGESGTDPVARERRVRTQKSVLDFIREDFKRISKSLGTHDGGKLNEYLEAVREVEIRVQRAEEKTAMELPEMHIPVGIPVQEDHLRLMYDLLLLAFQTDMTRVFTFMPAREYSEIVYTNLGHKDPHHPLTHHRGDDAKIRQAGEIDVYHAGLFGEFLQKMKSTRDGDGSSLLDNSMLVYGAGMGNGDDHSPWNLPIALIGGAGGKLRGGRHIEYKKGTPLANLHVAMLNIAGIPTGSFGIDHGLSTGALDLNAIA